MRILLPLLLLLPGTAAPEERRFLVSGFERVRVEGPFEVSIAPGISEARAEGSREAIEWVSIRTSGTTLVVRIAPPGGLDRGERPVALPRITITEQPPPMAGGVASTDADLAVAGRPARRSAGERGGRVGVRRPGRFLPHSHSASRHGPLDAFPPRLGRGSS